MNSDTEPQNAMRFYNRVGYHDYEGLTDSFDERERIVSALGENRALINLFADELVKHNHKNGQNRRAYAEQRPLIVAATNQMRIFNPAL